MSVDLLRPYEGEWVTSAKIKSHEVAVVICGSYVNVDSQQIQELSVSVAGIDCVNLDGRCGSDKLVIQLSLRRDLLLVHRRNLTHPQQWVRWFESVWSDRKQLTPKELPVPPPTPIVRVKNGAVENLKELIVAVGAVVVHIEEKDAIIDKKMSLLVWGDVVLVFDGKVYHFEPSKFSKTKSPPHTFRPIYNNVAESVAEKLKTLAVRADTLVSEHR